MRIGRDRYGILHGFGDAVRAEECGADGGGDGSGKRWGAASAATAAFRRRGALVGRESLGQRCVDHRRHGFFPKQGRQLAWRGNTAANSASRIIVGLQCRCRSPITMRACRWPISCICRKTGRRIAPVGARRVCPRRSASKPSHRSRLSSCVGRARPACARRGIVGRRLRRQHRSACEHHDARVVVRSPHCAEHDGLGASHRAVAAEADRP
jgi:hypothetical protein